MIDPTPLEKAHGCLLAVAIGDALGMPVETMTRAQIHKATGGAGIRSFIAPIADRKWMKELKIGDTTDDWQLTAVVARSLIRMRGFDIDDMAEEHVRALETSTFGWGGTTQRAIEEIRDKKRKPSQRAPSYGPKTGMGNGVIMKIAPLALRHAIAKQQVVKHLLRDTEDLGRLTHCDDRASSTAYCVARLMLEVFRNPCQKGSQVRDLLPKVLDQIRSEAGQKSAETTSGRLEILSDPAVTESSETLEAAVGNGFNCLDTMAFTIGTFIRHPTDFRAGVLEAVNAGGDADSNASIVGALIGINCGISVIPQEWRNFSPACHEACELSQQICSSL